MGLEDIMPSNKSQMEKRQKVYYFTYMWNLKSKQNKNKLIDTENRFVVTRGEGCYRAGQRDQLYGDG